ncbi:alpha/beta hydrolase [Vibrio fortis]|uniref:alpha/beta hydrolase n=1 Tax=Vibrio fortis TaxID=212667 RepID=UPI003EB9A6FB
MKIVTSLLVISLSALALTGCSSVAEQPEPLHTSAQYYNYIQPSFDQYVETTTEWLEENRAFITDDHQKELAMNAPYSKGDPNSDKAILLAHGLGDSPFSFRDISSSLAQQGFYVQVVLLPGHGSDPQHMSQVNYQDWQTLVDHYANLLKQEHDQVWLGGFSTGGNLVSIHVLDNDGIDGLMLFSPGFQTVTPFLERLTPLVAMFTDGWTAEETNFAKYSSAPINSALAYSESAKVLRDKIEDRELDIPTLLVAAEADSVIDADALQDYFENHFTHPNSKLVWYGENRQFDETSKTQVYSMHRDDLKISTASHMSPLFAPENSYYGQHGEKIICENSLRSANTEACKNGESTWFSAWGYTEKGRIHARLTWNPYYAELESTMRAVVQ